MVTVTCIYRAPFWSTGLLTELYEVCHIHTHSYREVQYTVRNKGIDEVHLCFKGKACNVDSKAHGWFKCIAFFRLIKYK